MMPAAIKAFSTGIFMHAKISWLDIPTTDCARAVRIYEAIFHTRLRMEHTVPDPEKTALLHDALLAHREHADTAMEMHLPAQPDHGTFIAHFSDTHGNLVALHVHH